MAIGNSPYHGSSDYNNGLRARNLTFKKIVKEVMRDRLNNRFMVQMENMLRRIVQEEFDRRIQPYVSSSWGSIGRPCLATPSSRPRFKLRFINSPPSSIFTGSKIETEDGSPIAIELVDTTTNVRVVSGPLSSSRVEIVPLNADFTEESWTVEGFKRNILKQREGKRPLLTGDLTVILKEGVGMIAGDVTFSDNSSWTRSRKFRLGARLTGGGGAVEARSEAFGCKDQRGESYKKHHPPYPGDEVWRLEKIAKDGVSATRLGEHGIKTVKDFRRWLATNPTALYSIVAGGISKKIWEAIVSHAMRCVLDETECYIYNAKASNYYLLFNSVYEVIKVSVSGSGGPFRNVDDLNLTINQPFLDQLKLEAYQNLNSFTPLNGPQRSLQFQQNPGFGIACSELQHMEFQGCSDPSNALMSLYLPTSSPTGQPEMLMSFENSPAATFHIDEKFLTRTLRNSFRAREHDLVHGESQSQTVVTRGYMEEDEDENGFANHHYHDIPSNWSPGMTHWTQQTLDGLCVSMSGTEEAGVLDVRIANIVGSPRARWCKVKAAFKIREVWRNTTARNRNRNKSL